MKGRMPRAKTPRVECKNAKRGDSAASKDVKETNECSALLNKLLESNTIDPRHGDVDPQTDKHEQPQRCENPAAQLRVLHQLGNHFSGAGVTSPTDKHGEGRKEWG